MFNNTLKIKYKYTLSQRSDPGWGKQGQRGEVDEKQNKFIEKQLHRPGVPFGRDPEAFKQLGFINYAGLQVSSNWLV